MNILSIANLSIACQKKSIIDRVSFSMAKGEVLGLMGPSGSGKSTIAKAIASLNPPSFRSSGSIVFLEQNLLDFSDNTIGRIRGKEMGFLAQDPFSALHPAKKIKHQIFEAPLFHKICKTEEWIEELTHFIEIEHLLDRYPHQLSGGEKQRVCLAIALSCRPKLLIADEPTTALDEELHLEVLSLLYNLAKRYALSVFFISHDIQSITSLCDRYLLLEKGHIIKTVKNNHGTTTRSKKSFQKI